ncbi:hypothetical protein DL95DRAFT_377773 [Leptodontidium sp. 2 PMI_412]|nr:hypothetical protein DL95DRAFT_377773 [Leptodontidium sp. 2 PMI_412]
MTRLSARDLEEVCKAIGVCKRNGDANRNKPTSTIWPPKGLDEGLYKDVITSRCKSQYTYHFVASLLHTCLILQLILGATLTALGSTSKKNGTVITILAAINSINAGIIALLHNSGLPNRIRKDKDEYEKVERFLTGLVDSGVVPVGTKTADVIKDCQTRYDTAKKIVASNKPEVYAGTPPSTGIVS